MASTQNYFTTMRNFFARLTTGVTADDGSSQTAATWFGLASGGAAGAVPTTDWMLSGLKITDSSATGVGNIADCLVRVFMTDPASGGTSKLIDTIDLGDPAVSSVTSKGLNVYVPYGPQWTFGANCAIAFNVSVTTTAGNLDVVGFAMAS
jgi:hypothetical protein